MQNFFRQFKLIDLMKTKCLQVDLRNKMDGEHRPQE
jgi:hypothetical protein